MKFYSETLGKFYNTQEDCVQAEKEHDEKVAKAKAEKEAKANERASRAKAVEELYKKAIDAKAEYDKALKEFLKDYGSFHATFKTTDPFFGIFDWF